jgi:hypothetical protein
MYTKRLKYGTRIQEVIQARASPNGSEPTAPDDPVLFQG